MLCLSLADLAPPFLCFFRWLELSASAKRLHGQSALRDDNDKVETVLQTVNSLASGAPEEKGLRQLRRFATILHQLRAVGGTRSRIKRQGALAQGAQRGAPTSSRGRWDGARRSVESDNGPRVAANFNQRWGRHS